MKTCSVCEQEKLEIDFYKGNAKCKACYLDIVRAYRLSNIEKIREYDRYRGKDPKRIAAALVYSKTQAGKASHNKASVKWSKTGVLKRAAHSIVQIAIEGGRLHRPDHCSECLAVCIPHGHHDDYAYPMTVRWLCSKCHRAYHKLKGK